MTIKAFHRTWLLAGVQRLCWLSAPFLILQPQYFELWPFIIGTFLVSMMGSSAGMHRYFGHKSFNTGKLRHWFLAFTATLSTQGSIAWWVDIHRIHHAYADTEHDPIAPSAIGIFRSFFCLQDKEHFQRIRPRAVVKELRNPAVKFMHDWYWFVILGYCVAWYIIGGWTFVLNAYLIPVFLIRFNFGVNNIFGHGVFPNIGYRNYDSNDDTRNGLLINALTGFGLLGEALHNNHHGNPSAYYYKVRPYELDPTGWIIKHAFVK